MTGGHGRGIVWPPKGVEPAAPATPRPGARLQPWRTPSGTPAQRVIHPPAASAGERLTAALADVADSMAALGEAAKPAAAAVPQLPAGKLAEPGPQMLEDIRWLNAANPSLGQPVDPLLAAAFVLAETAHDPVVVETPGVVVTIPPVRMYVAPPADTRPGWIGRLRRRLFGEPPQ